jgi:predicted small secreted protein
MKTNDSIGIRVLLAAIAMAFILPQLSGCNTMRGAGEDIETAGEAIQDEADEQQND